MTLVEKLSPERIRTGARFHGIVGYILGQDWSEPKVVSVVQTSDDFILIGSSVDPMANELIGTGAELDRNLLGLAEAAGLTEDEIKTLMAARRLRVGFSTGHMEGFDER